MEAKIYRTKCEESPIPKGGLEIVTQVTFKIEEEKKRFLLRLVDLIKENYETPKSEAHEIIEDKENGTGDENNSDDEDIMFFIDDKEKKNLQFMCIFPSFLLFQLKKNLLKTNFNIVSSENFRTLLKFGPEIFRTI